MMQSEERLHIEDPFDLPRNLRDVMTKKTERILYEQMVMMDTMCRRSVLAERIGCSPETSPLFGPELLPPGVLCGPWSMHLVPGFPMGPLPHLMPGLEMLPDPAIDDAKFKGKHGTAAQKGKGFAKGLAKFPAGGPMSLGKGGTTGKGGKAGKGKIKWQ